MTRLPPVGVVRAATGVRTAIQGLARRMVPPEVGVLEVLSAFMASTNIVPVRTAESLSVMDDMDRMDRARQGNEYRRILSFGPSIKSIVSIRSISSINRVI